MGADSNRPRWSVKPGQLRLGATAMATLALLVSVPAAHATFPGKNGRLAFSAGVEDLRDGTTNSEIFSVRRDGAHLTRLTLDSALDTHPAWSPDGARIAFASDRGRGNGATDIYVMDPDGTNVNQLTTTGLENASPAWSPDGAKIAFTRADSDFSGTDIWIMNADGSDQRDLTGTAGGGIRTVTWSPDGSRIAFVSDRGGDGDEEIYTMDPDGSNQTKLTTAAARVMSLDWSPDGRQVALERDPGDGFPVIHLIQADGTRLRPLMNGLNPAWGRNPAWSPDGTRIVFTDGHGGLTTVAPDGTGSTPVLLPYRGDHADWQGVPLPPLDATPPDAPRSLFAKGRDREVTLSWADNAEADFDHYVVYRATMSGGPYTRLTPAAIAASRYTDADVANGTPYHYVVRAVDRSGNASLDSAEASSTPAATAQPEFGDRVVELVSTGSRPDTGQFGARFLGTARDGQDVFFATREQLVDADTNGSLDVYMRTGAVTTLISTGPTGRSGVVADDRRPPDFEWALKARPFGVTPDGEHVFFATDAALVAADTDTNVDVYERAGDETALVSTGATARCLAPDGCNSYFASASTDGTRVVFISTEGLVPEDTDGVCPAFEFNVLCSDVYERSFGTTKLVSIGSLNGGGAPGSEPSLAHFEGASADGTRIYFSTSETLEPEDEDAACEGDVLYPDCVDVYERSSGSTKLVSPGPSEGSTNSNQFFADVSEDGRRIFLWTDAPLFAADTDGATDLYEHSPAGTALISDGLDIADVDLMTWRGTVFTPDGSRVFFDTLAQLTREDADTQRDVYRRTGGKTTLVSTGTSGEGARPATVAGIAGDGSRVFFETEERLTAADADDYRDVYGSSGSTTRLVSGSGEFGPGASFLRASADGSRVFFKTSESLSPADADSSEDIYENFKGNITLLSRGGPPTPTDFRIDLAGLSDDGKHVYFLSDERLVGADQDDVRDVYVARIATDTPPSTPTQPPAPPESTPVTSLSLRLEIDARYRLRRVLRGLVVPVECSQPCTVTLRLSLGRRSARRLGLISAKNFVLSRRTAAVAAGKRRLVRLRLSKRSVRRLKRARSLRLKLEAVATDSSGRRATVTRRIVARR